MTAAIAHLSDGQLVGVVLLLAAIALCLYAAWEMRHAPLDDPEEPEAEPDDSLYAAMASVLAAELMPEVYAHLDAR